VREEWTEEQIQDLIVGSGAFVHPDKVQVRRMMSAWCKALSLVTAVSKHQQSNGGVGHSQQSKAIRLAGRGKLPVLDCRPGRLQELVLR
jgi:hypothetical protein